MATSMGKLKSLNKKTKKALSDIYNNCRIEGEIPTSVMNDQFGTQPFERSEKKLDYLFYLAEQETDCEELIKVKEYYESEETSAMEQLRIADVLLMIIL